MTLAANSKLAAIHRGSDTALLARGAGSLLQKMKE